MNLRHTRRLHLRRDRPLPLVASILEPDFHLKLVTIKLSIAFHRDISHLADLRFSEAKIGS